MDLKDAARYYGVLAIAGMGVVGSPKNEATSNSGLITRVGTCRGRSWRLCTETLEGLRRQARSV